jgi:hypothetical protein
MLSSGKIRLRNLPNPYSHYQESAGPLTPDIRIVECGKEPGSHLANQSKIFGSFNGEAHRLFEHLHLVKGSSMINCFACSRIVNTHFLKLSSQRNFRRPGFARASRLLSWQI